MRLSFVSFLLAALLKITLADGQTIYQFTEGLVVTDVHRYGREAIFTDQLAYQLYSGQLKQPSANAKLVTHQQGIDVIWKPIKVDSTGKFRGDVVMNGYIYLTYQSDRTQNAVLNISGNSMFYFNGEPHGGDIYGDGWMKTPVRLKTGINEILIRCGSFSRWQGVTARLVFSQKSVSLSADDATLPHIVLGETKKDLLGALVVINHSEKPQSNLVITATLNGKTRDTAIPVMHPLSSRKSAFYFDPAAISNKGEYACAVVLKQNGKILDQQTITIQAVYLAEHHSYTFISHIDGSVQYYSVAPQSRNVISRPALFLSVHGAGVQAIGQAQAYQSKDWGVLVAPTNRRPRGFNWEDWGRIDALEVLELATKRYQPDPAKIYLTGHSMGGHGTWYLGATYSDKWAAIAPCAGYPTLTGYGSADGRIPDKGKSDMEKILLRASNASNVLELAKNYRDVGVYIHHGDQDEVVSVDYARQMRKVLGDFHHDFSYYEYPGGSHWFGSESVDWAPIFDFFKWHKVKADSAANRIDFTTANPAISSRHYWAAVIQQNTPLAYSRIHLDREKKTRSITGTTENVATLKLNLSDFQKGDTLVLSIDSVVIRYVMNGENEIYMSGHPQWKIGIAPGSKQKNDQRSGTFKEAFNHRMVFVYATGGNPKENLWAYNKARYDAEVWYYRGNGAVDVVADKNFASEKYKDRGVVLYGNAETNSAWHTLLNGCPISVSRDHISIGARRFDGNDLAAYFTWPRPDSDVAMVAVVAGTGLLGMHASDANQYFAAGSGFPDYMIFTADMLRHGASAIKSAGFYNNKWILTE
jgi:predicted esterase